MDAARPLPDDRRSAWQLEAPPADRGGVRSAPKPHGARPCGASTSASSSGTFVLIAFGTASSRWTSPACRSPDAATAITADGDWLLITFGLGDGGHLRHLRRRRHQRRAHQPGRDDRLRAPSAAFPWNKVPGYIIAQILGAFAGAALVYWNYHDAISGQRRWPNNLTRDGAGTHRDIRHRPRRLLRQLLGADPQRGHRHRLPPHLRLRGGRPDEPAAQGQPRAADHRPRRVRHRHVATAPDSGYAINPARDLGPRIFAWLEGWGDAAFPGDTGGILTAYWWVPIVAPIIGAIIGGHRLRASSSPTS